MIDFVRHFLALVQQDYLAVTSIANSDLGTAQLAIPPPVLDLIEGILILKDEIFGKSTPTVF